VEEHSQGAEEEMSLGRAARRVARWLLLSTFTIVAGGSDPGAQQSTRILSCDGPFAPDTNEHQLRKAFGDANVTTGSIYLGEGASESGTILFPKSPQDRLEILWSSERYGPRALRVLGDSTRWKTREGLTLGLTLKQVERLNRRPFRLLGFDWDNGGTTMSWSGGPLAAPDKGGCEIRARFGVRNVPPEIESVANQVSGEREFSSGHPVMQGLNPIVRWIFVSYKP